MSFVLQLGTVETPLEKKNGSQQSSALPQEASSGALAGGEDPARSQILQCLESTPEIPTGHVISFPTVKSVSVTYPVAKAAREVQRIAGSQTTNATQVLATRVISQKLPSTGHQAQVAPVASVTLNASSHVAHAPVNSQPSPSPGNGVAHVYPLQHAAQSKQQTRSQAVGCEGKQQGLHQKLQPVSSQQKVISAATSIPNIQRIHVKAQNLVAPGQTVNLQKVKAVTNAGQGVTVQRNSVPRIQAVQKGQVTAAGTQVAQFAVNQVANNASVQRGQQGANSTLQKAQGNVAAMQKVAQVYNSQKVSAQIVGGHANHKAQHQQIIGNQQQGLQKLQGQQQLKGLPVSRQQQSTTAVNNVQKPSNNSVAGIQKAQGLGQVQAQAQAQAQQQSAQIQKHAQVQPSQHQRSQPQAALQKSQTVVAVNSSRVQSLASVCKSNSVPNISKMQQTANLLAVGKQQVIQSPQSQQLHVQNSCQLQQQLLQQTSQSQTQQQITPKQQQANPTQQAQRSHGITNVHQKVTAIATAANSQRAQVVNSKVQQQQMVMRVGVPKGQAQGLQQGSLKTVPQKMGNTAKTPNSQNAAQQPLHRNANPQPVKIIQQQQQNAIGPQATQKQPGCVKTIPPQKSAQRNHAQKVAGIKTSLNTNVTAVKSQGPTVTTQKANIKTLIPQQTVAPNMLMHKSQPIKIQQQQTLQQKQLIMTSSQFPQQIRQQSGQIKTLLPVTSMEPRKDVESKLVSLARAIQFPFVALTSSYKYVAVCTVER